MTLAVVIPTLNEKQDLPYALASVQFADETLIVDSGSTDHTVAIAKKMGAKVIHHPFVSYSETRNFADRNIYSDWILSIDADVSVPPKLAQEITNTLKTNTIFQAFRLGRVNIIWGKPILHTDWGPRDDCHIRLYRRGSGKWQSSVHEQFITDKPVGVMKNLLVHQNYRTVSEFIEKTNSYSSLDKHHYQFRLWLVPVKDFLKRYFYKLGFLDGYHGLFLSYLQAIYHLNVLVKTKTR